MMDGKVSVKALLDDMKEALSASKRKGTIRALALILREHESALGRCYREGASVKKVKHWLHLWGKAEEARVVFQLTMESSPKPKLVFLVLDGVLNNLTDGDMESGVHLSKRNVSNLKFILGGVEGPVRLVVASRWWVESQALIQAVEEYNLPIPSGGAPVEWSIRRGYGTFSAKDIHDRLVSEEVEDFVVLAHFRPLGSDVQLVEEFVEIDPVQGLTRAKASEAVRILNRRAP